MNDKLANAVVDVAAGFKNSASNAGLYQRLIQKFLDREQTALDRLRDSMDRQDRHEAIRLVHTLRSSALTLGAGPLGEAAARLEVLWKQGGTLELPLAEWDNLAACLPPVLAFFANYLAVTRVQAPAPPSPILPATQVMPQLSRLAKLIADSDTEACDVAQQVARALSGTGVTHHAQKMVAQIQMYEFETAQILLQDITLAVQAG